MDKLSATEVLLLKELLGAIVFVDYLNKWHKVFATKKDQSSLTIARLLIEHINSRHGVPRELLSDKGKSFLSKLMYDFYKLLGIKKVNTTAYHPQTRWPSGKFQSHTDQYVS